MGNDKLLDIGILKEGFPRVRSTPKTYNLFCNVPLFPQKSHDLMDTLDTNGYKNTSFSKGAEPNMKQTSSTNQASSGASDLEEIEVEDDPELAAIATRLEETASYAIDPEFMEELRKGLLQQFIEHRTKETI